MHTKNSTTEGVSETSFQPWLPRHGQVFHSIYALDLETTAIEDSRPWRTPHYILAAATDGDRGYFLSPANVRAFFGQHEKVEVVFHNAQFDLRVIHKYCPEFDIYRLVENGLVWDTMIEHQLLTLGTEGHTANDRGQSTLATCCKKYLGIDLTKDIKDQSGRPIRESFGQFLNQPLKRFPTQYLAYLEEDAVATYQLHQELRERTTDLIWSDTDAWGGIDEDQTEQNMWQFGPLTHHIQLKASIALADVTANGLHIDSSRREQLQQEFELRLGELRKVLKGSGFLPGEKSSRAALQSILKQIQRGNPKVTLPLTDKTGEISTSQEALQPLLGQDPFIDAYLQYNSIQQLQNTFLTKLGKSVIRPSYRTLVRTGRTSSFGELNAQNLPREDGVRDCFIPSPGCVFLSADYAAIELATLSVAIEQQFGITSEMQKAINEGQDLHRLLAATVMRKQPHEVSDEERRKAKAINFGRPGGMGVPGLCRVAKASYGVELSEEEAEAYLEVWDSQFPEMEDFLQRDDSPLYRIEAELGLTWDAYTNEAGRAVGV